MKDSGIQTATADSPWATRPGETDMAVQVRFAVHLISQNDSPSPEIHAIRCEFTDVTLLSKAADPEQSLKSELKLILSTV